MNTLIQTGLLSVSIFAVMLLVINLLTGSRRGVKARMKQIQLAYGEEHEESKSFFDRVVKPVYDRIFDFFSRFTPANVSDEYDDLLTSAGLRHKYTPVQLLMNQVLLSIVLGISSFYIMKTFFGEVNILFVIFRMIVAGYLPIFYIRKKGDERKRRIENALPNLLDMVYISVEAGLSFDAAMTITSQRTDNELSDEIVRAMGEISKGRVREDALYSIAERTKVDDVRSFISTIIQSEKLGSNISNVLRIQAEVIRDKRTQRAEEAINKMPIKMLLPMVFLLLPALFIVIMGPAVISFMQSGF